jgi:hypothetical protein
MLPEEPLRPRLRVVPGDELTVSRPTFPDAGVVLAVCVPFWAGIAWLVAGWL